MKNRVSVAGPLIVFLPAGVLSVLWLVWHADWLAEVPAVWLGPVVWIGVGEFLRQTLLRVWVDSGGVGTSWIRIPWSRVRRIRLASWLGTCALEVWTSGRPHQIRLAVSRANLVAEAIRAWSGLLVVEADARMGWRVLERVPSSTAPMEPPGAAVEPCEGLVPWIENLLRRFKRRG